jgi:NADPH-dependent 2,4-dienoyl-CoA reductase/sulfur reductase-like enzyme
MNTAIMKIFDLGVSRTGLSFGQARDLGLDPEKIIVQSRDRARYYPGSQTMTSLVIVSRKDRRVLGAQMAGEVGSVKRIDVYSTAIHNRMTIDGLFDLDLAYAPPFSPVYDPVLLAARVARKKI